VNNASRFWLKSFNSLIPEFLAPIGGDTRIFDRLIEEL
jgi:hypothetical protein